MTAPSPSSPLPTFADESPAQRLAIADVRYLWTEVERLKMQVHSLQQSERHAVDEQHQLRAYVASFVTQTQLDAALGTRTSHASVVASIDRTRAELLDVLDRKADVSAVQAIQTSKLDISVYETSAWDITRVRAALEQNVRDLFAQFAHKIETQVSQKLSIDDFDRIFNPETNGQKAAIESAAQRIARINHQLIALEEYVQADHERQQKLEELCGTVVDLSHDHNASRRSIEELQSELDTTTNRVQSTEDDLKQTRHELEDLVARVSDDHTKTEAESQRQQLIADRLRVDVDNLTHTSQQAAATLAQIQQFTQHALLKSVDARLKQLTDALNATLDDARAQQQKLKQLLAQQLAKVANRVTHTTDRTAALETRVHTVETVVTSLGNDVAAVKGPLVTVARNLREENVAILEEIRRSQDDSRDILIDYKGLLEKDATPATVRPPSSTSRAATSAVSRKQRQQQLHALATRLEAPNNNNAVPVPRPRTSNGRLGASPASRTRARTASSSCTSPSAAVRDPGILPHPMPPRPKSEACARATKSLLSTMTTGRENDDDESLDLFVFPATSDNES